MEISLTDDVSVMTVQVPTGPQFFRLQIPGVQGPPGKIELGPTTTGEPGTQAIVTSSLRDFDGYNVLTFTIPRGDVGASNVLSIGTVTLAPAGSPAEATLTGVSPAQVLNLVIPKGDQGIQGIQGIQGETGPANTLAIGSVTTGVAGSAAGATITGAAPNQTLNLTIPKGDKGDKGDIGNTGAQGAGVLVLTSAAPIPAGTAPGTAIFRTV